jgi:hypothetical protein
LKKTEAELRRKVTLMLPSFVTVTNTLLHPKYHATPAMDLSRQLAIAHLTSIIVLTIHAWTALFVLRDPVRNMFSLGCGKRKVFSLLTGIVFFLKGGILVGSSQGRHCVLWSFWHQI